MITKRDVLKAALIPDWPLSPLKEENGTAINAEAAGRLIQNREVSLLDCKIKAVGWIQNGPPVVYRADLVATARSFGRLHFVFDVSIPRPRFVIRPEDMMKVVTPDWPPQEELIYLDYAELIDDRGVLVHSYHLANGRICCLPGTKLTSSINILFNPVDYGFSRY